MNTEKFHRHPDYEQFLREIEQIVADVKRPANEVILDEVDFIKKLRISKRLASYLRVKGLITYSKVGGKIYYRLSDILKMLDNHEVKAMIDRRKTKWK